MEELLTIEDLMAAAPARPRDLNVSKDDGPRLHGKPEPKVFIETYGCQMNDHDTEIMLGILAEMGYQKSADPAEADLILFNTCAVREGAVEKAFGRIGQLRQLKYTNPDLVIGVCGCVPQAEGYVDKMLRIFPHLDIIFGTHNIHQLPNLIRESRTVRETVVDVWQSMGDELVEDLPATRQGDLKAYTTIIYGCDKRCTYCIVPYTRGDERSRQPESILAEVRQLGREGFKEVTLLGQNVNAYGKDLGTTDFGQLLTLLDQQTPGVERIRYTTSHPKDFTREMVEAIAKSSKVCDHFHIPVQSGSNTTLRRMARRYTREKYLELIGWVKELCPEATITTDLIVGFPGETAEEFEETLSLVEEVRFDAAFTFMYSPREGTPAAKWADQIPPEEKKARLNRLMELQNRISREKNEAMVGKVYELLVEGEGKRDGVMCGRTTGNKLVYFEGDSSLYGQLVKVRITEAQTWTLYGELA